MKLYNVFKHLKTICKHRHLVFIHCCKAGIPIQGLLHDLSKFYPTEFWTSVKYYQGYRSPNSKEREVKGYSNSWLHHKGRNKHHMEYWIDYSTDQSAKGMTGMKMPVKYVVEMFCDRVAACKTYNKEEYTDSDALNYYMKGRHQNIINEETENLLINLLTMLEKYGESETFKYIRNMLNNK